MLHPSLPPALTHTLSLSPSCLSQLNLLVEDSEQCLLALRALLRLALFLQCDLPPTPSGNALASRYRIGQDRAGQDRTGHLTMTATTAQLLLLTLATAPAIHLLVTPL